MSWRGSAEHIDANVPDYQKMLQGRYTSSGWSSIPSMQTSYASGSHSTSQTGRYLNSRPGSSSYDRPVSQHNYIQSSYQPSKYGLTSYNQSLESNINTLEIDDDSPYLSDRKAYIDKNYGILAREFDLGPFRSRNRKETDYSSDTGTRRGHSRPADYSSDSGMGYRRHRPKSAEFDVDLPSPTSTDRGQNDELFASPIKSQMPGIDDMGFSDNQSPYSEGNSPEHFQNYIPQTGPVSSSSSSHGHHSQSSDRETKSTGQIGDFGTNKDSQNLQLDSHDTRENNSERLSFFSPPLYKGDIGSTSLADKDSAPVGNRTDDLTHWQRQHQQSQRNASMDGHSPRESTFRQYSHREKHVPGPYQGYIHDSVDGEDQVSPRSQNGRDPSSRSHQKSSYKHINLPAAEAIIRDKDAIIEDLKGELDTKLELIKKYENELHRAQASRRGGHTDLSPTLSKMQELEYRNAELRSDLTKLQKQNHREVEELEIKLGGAEHEIDQLKAALKKSQPSLMDMKEKMFGKEKEVAEWKTKCAILTKNYEQLEDKVGGLERYLSDLPTIEEFTKTAEELATCREDNEVKTDQIEALEKRLGETSQLLSERETTILELEEKQQQLGSKMRELSIEIQHIRSGGDGKALFETREELAETKEIKDRVIVDLEKAKKLLEMNHRRMRQQEAKHQTDLGQVQERLSQEEESVLALREEVLMKEEHIEGLKKSMKELASRKQDLRNENLILKEQLKQVEHMSDDENVKLQRKVVKEMTTCFTELNSLAQICIQRAEGKDPNVSLLLGMKGMSLEDEEEEAGAGASAAQEQQTLKHWFTKVKELRMEVEQVRKMICNKYAEEMGDNLNCATQ